MSLEVKENVHEETTPYQDIKVFDSTSYGRVLLLDGVFQCTERDEFAYSEMLAHVPLFSHPNPKNVLVIGGGDGAVVREVCRHQSVESVDVCELDERVVEVSKSFLPTMSVGFNDERVNVFNEDGFKFLNKAKSIYDVIIVDSSDPVGPAEVLYRQPFYEALHKSLREDGIVVTQAECMWLHQEVIQKIRGFASEYFNRVNYAQISIPTYPCGTIGMLCCSKGDSMDCRKPERLTGSMASDLRYYTPEIHSASFVLPAFAHRAFYFSK